MLSNGEHFSPSGSAARHFLGSLLSPGLSAVGVSEEDASFPPLLRIERPASTPTAQQQQKHPARAPLSFVTVDAGDSLSDGADGREVDLKGPALHLQFRELPACIGEVLLIGCRTF